MAGVANVPHHWHLTTSLLDSCGNEVIPLIERLGSSAECCGLLGVPGATALTLLPQVGFWLGGALNGAPYIMGHSRVMARMVPYRVLGTRRVS